MWVSEFGVGVTFLAVESESRLLLGQWIGVGVTFRSVESGLFLVQQCQSHKVKVGVIFRSQGRNRNKIR